MVIENAQVLLNSFFPNLGVTSGPNSILDVSVLGYVQGVLGLSSARLTSSC